MVENMSTRRYVPVHMNLWFICLGRHTLSLLLS